MRTSLFWPLAAALLCLAPAPKSPPPADRPSAQVDSINLDLPADFPPQICGGNVYLFSSGGRNQTMVAGESAPSCNTQPLIPALPPKCGGDGPFVLEKDGALWQVGDGFPKAIEAGLTGAVAMEIGPGGRPVILFKRHIRMEDGARVELGSDTEGLDVLPNGFWVFGGGSGSLLDASGRRLWGWEPAKLHPKHACISERRIFVGTAEGELVALDENRGKELFRFRTGGAIVSTPVARDGFAIFTSRDHIVRSISCKGGQLSWQRRFKGRPDFGPILTGAGVWIGEYAGGGIYLLGAKDGKTLWSWSSPEGNMLHSPCFKEDRAAILTWGEKEFPSLHTIRLQSAGSAKGGR